ncbi:MAG: transglutaminase domain-containing protein [Myxococcota bacterium]
MSKTSPRYVLLALLLAGSVASLGLADGPVLHEYVPGAGDDDLPVMRGGGEPTGIVYDGEILPAPEGGERRPDERAMSATPGDGHGQESPGRRSPAFRPDRITALEGTLGYYTVFNPTITPFKRVTALDAAVLGTDGTPVLGVADPETEVVDVIGTDAPSAEPRDRFWGNVVLDFRAGRVVPFPSVAPDSRILSLRTEPEVSVRLEKDRADNFFAVLEAGEPTEVRAVFLTDARRDYFGVAAIPDVPADTLANEIFALPDRVREDALTFAREIGLDEGSSLRDVLEKLTLHFRAFVESREPPEATGNIFLDLARGGKGVCRHRAYAFVITAQALGVPTRFVQNEAHAWVEAKIADLGWMRIDLGGAASALEARGGEDRPVYEPAEPDPLPRPRVFRDGYSQLEGEVRGLRQGNGNGASLANFPMTAPSDEGAASTGTEPAPVSLEALLDDEAAPEVARPLRLRLDRRRHDVFRGRTLQVTGSATDPDGEGAEGLRVEVLLRDRTERLLGVTVTREGGAFQAAVGVPPDLPVGEYRLIVRTPGNEAYFPATAR